MMWTVTPEVKKRRRKGKLVLALICGPVFSMSLLFIMWLTSLLPDDFPQSIGWALCGSLALTAAIGDRIGKRFNLTSQQFAAVVAFSCVTCLITIFSIAYAIRSF